MTKSPTNYAQQIISKITKENNYIQFQLFTTAGRILK